MSLVRLGATYSSRCAHSAASSVCPGALLFPSFQEFRLSTVGTYVHQPGLEVVQAQSKVERLASRTTQQSKVTGEILTNYDQKYAITQMISNGLSRVPSFQ